MGIREEIKNKTTPQPWTIGRTLLTEETRRWAAARRVLNDAMESRMIFADFKDQDQGRGRKLVATFERAEDARLVMLVMLNAQLRASTLRGMRDEIARRLGDGGTGANSLDLIRWRDQLKDVIEDMEIAS